jgi:phosphoenolpyruvate carboxykinase (GTP)
MPQPLTNTIAKIRHPELARWVEEVALRCRPDRIHLCDGSKREYREMARLMVQQGSAIPLNPAKKPNSLFVRSNPGDVARVEDRTFICSADPADAGPYNIW